MDNPEQEEIRNLILNRTLKEEDSYQVLQHLINMTASTQEILRVKSYESLTFHLKKNGVKPQGNVQVDRLSLVHPPTFECSLHLKINGYFKIKYKTTPVSLPMPVEPFEAIYRGIFVQSEQGFLVRNEQVILPENLILQ